jgi:hypothetical protein
MMHKFFVALGIRLLPQNCLDSPPLPQVSLSTRLSINNSGLCIDLLVMGEICAGSDHAKLQQLR